MPPTHVITLQWDILYFSTPHGCQPLVRYVVDGSSSSMMRFTKPSWVMHKGLTVIIRPRMSGRGKVFGSNEINIEHWKPLKRLPGHESDVTDIAWAPEDRYLASVGLDSNVIVWCGYTLGEVMATQLDDKSLKIWRTTDWSLEAKIRKPFEDSPGSTFFHRLSWSPDGAHITASLPSSFCDQ
ncbi:hypothetical protein BU15DRAFT_62059 [Melanogaster broomeanus]|nr:hypothetical protein BU15DRAFT_62059 [Melanogaster broomeanus]